MIAELIKMELIYSNMPLLQIFNWINIIQRKLLMNFSHKKILTKKIRKMPWKVKKTILENKFSWMKIVKRMKLNWLQLNQSINKKYIEMILLSKIKYLCQQLKKNQILKIHYKLYKKKISRILIKRVKKKIIVLVWCE